MRRIFVDKKNVVIAIMAVVILLLGYSFFIIERDSSEISENAVEQQKLLDSNVAGVQTEPSNTAVPTKESSLNSNNRQVATLVRVVDGDTISVSINGKNETVRIIGIDTPEVIDIRKTVECFGKEASDFATVTLQDNKTLFLEPDPTQGERDKYQRMLRYVWIDNGKEDFGKSMIDGGFASEYTYNLPYKYQNEYKQAEKEARENGRGLWADDACISAGETSPTTQQQSQIDTSGGDKDCSDFKVQDEAQTYFESKGGSPTNNVDRLDSDHDGIACESLP